MAKKKIKKFLKKAAKAAVIGGALYAGAKGLGKLKGKGLKGNATLSTDRFFKKPFKHDLESYKPKFVHPPYDAGADKSEYFKKGGRIGAKHGGRVKSMGVAKRGGGVAKR